MTTDKEANIQGENASPTQGNDNTSMNLDEAKFLCLLIYKVDPEWQ